MNIDKENHEILLSFLSLFETVSNDGYMGCILVTDIKGIPKEFRCTYPVKPNLIQKVLYGDMLLPYIGVDVCGIPLFNSLKSNPHLTFVNREFLIDVRKSISCPVAYIRRVGEAIDVELSKDFKTELKQTRIDCSTGKFQPIIAVSHSDFEEDLTFARDILEKVFNYLDPLEPFTRISRAVEILGKQDKRFQ